LLWIVGIRGVLSNPVARRLRALQQTGDLIAHMFMRGIHELERAKATADSGGASAITRGAKKLVQKPRRLPMIEVELALGSPQV
jgi:hypothetical protein